MLAVVDDLPWLDRASAMVLGVVARRLPGSRVGFLAVSRSGEDGFFDRRGLPVHDVLPLTEAAAGELVGDRFPALAPRVRQRLLADARGNPLALLELPVALSGMQRAGTGPLPQWLPLSRRLRAVFDSRITALPVPTRQVLLLAALDGTGSLPTLRSTAPGPNGLDALTPAERSGLVRVADDGRRLEFRHPLTRSAVVALSTSAELRRAHAALARQLAGEPERQAWHLAQAAAGPDERRGRPARAGRAPDQAARRRDRSRHRAAARRRPHPAGRGAQPPAGGGRLPGCGRDRRPAGRAAPAGRRPPGRRRAGRIAGRLGRGRAPPAAQRGR